jgi:Leucine-rich repeat (LRR) protein
MEPKGEKKKKKKKFFFKFRIMHFLLMQIFVVVFLTWATHSEALTVGELTGLAQLKSSLCLSWPSQPNCTNAGTAITCDSSTNSVTRILIARSIQTTPCPSRTIPDIWTEFYYLSRFEIICEGYQISGALPKSIYSLSRLRFFRVEGCPGFSISDSIQNLTALTTLELDQNSLSGPLPHSIGKLVALETLALNNNFFTGPLPSSLGSLTNLTVMNLNYNQFSGSIPPSLGNLIKLTSVTLYENLLTGTLPASLGNWPSATSINLGRNQLSGPIPETFGNLRALISLDLGVNLLEGALPNSFGQLTNLKSLSLDTNKFTVLSDSICNWTSLTHLYLNNNLLNSSIPLCIGNLKALRGLWLSANKLHGPLPDSIGELTDLLSLRLHGNNIKDSYLNPWEN